MRGAIKKLHGAFSESLIDDEIVVMSLNTGDFFSLTGTARDIWQLIDGNRDRNSLVDELAGAYGIEQLAIVGEVGEFLSELRKAGLIAGE